MALYIIGITEQPPGEYIEKIIDSSVLVVAGKRLLARFASTIKGKDTFAIGGNLDVMVDTIAKTLLTGDVVVFATGDPLFFGVGRMLLNHFENEAVLLPAVSVMQQAFARLKISWENASFLSIHGREIKGLLKAVIISPLLFLFTDPKNSPDVVARILIENGFDHIIASVVEDVGEVNEKVLKRVPIGELCSMTFPGLNVMVLENSIEFKDKVAVPGMAEELFDYRNSMITKSEVRAVAISKMGLSNDSIVWDIGSGSGSVAVECARIARFGTVWAIEKDSTVHIESNIKKFDVNNIKVVCGKAPESLESIGDDPDIVFIGGSGGELKNILRVVKQRIKANGRIVMAIVSPTNFCIAKTELESLCFNFDITLLNVTRTKRRGGVDLLDPLTTVFIINTF